jgi:hypothetical protein
VILAHDKSLIGTDEDFLLDDRPHKGNARLFRGDFVLFKENEPEKSWHELWTRVHDRLEFWRKQDVL